MMPIQEHSSRQSTGSRWNRPARLTPLYHEHRARDATMIELDSWLIPSSYGDPEAEVAVLRTAVGLLDVSETGKIDVKGSEVETVLRGRFPDIEGFPLEKTAIAADGTMIYRLTNEEALLISASAAAAGMIPSLQTAAGPDADIQVVDLTGSWCGLRLLGPNAPALLERVSALDLAPDRFAPGAVVQGAVARVHAVIARQDRGNLPGYSVYVDRDLGVYLWDTLLELGAPLGLQPVGRQAVEALD